MILLLGLIRMRSYINRFPAMSDLRSQYTFHLVMVYLFLRQFQPAY